jgi:hypothetical protein
LIQNLPHTVNRRNSPGKPRSWRRNFRASVTIPSCCWER